eukprot:Pgem_evm1s15501
MFHPSNICSYNSHTVAYEALSKGFNNLRQTRERYFDYYCHDRHFIIDENGVVSKRGDGPKKCKSIILAGTFSEMPSADYLTIHESNRLTEIEEGAFDGLFNLEIAYVLLP